MILLFKISLDDSIKSTYPHRLISKSTYKFKLAIINKNRKQSIKCLLTYKNTKALTQLYKLGTCV